MDDHVGLQGLLLDEAFEADMTLEGSDAVVDEHVPLEVSRQGELSGTYFTLVALHSLQSTNNTGQGSKKCKKLDILLSVF